MQEVKFYIDNAYEAGSTRLSGNYEFSMDVEDDVFQALYKVWDKNDCTLDSTTKEWGDNEALHQLVNEKAATILNKFLALDKPEAEPVTPDSVLWEIHPETEGEFNWIL